MSNNNLFLGGPDGFMADGTPIYFKTRSTTPSSLQLSVYAALVDPSKGIPEEVKEWLRKSEENR